MNEMAQVLEAHGAFAVGEETVDSVAAQWEAAGFTPYQAAAWLDARCFEPGAATSLQAAGIGPCQASTEVDVEIGGYRDTVGYAVANGDMTVAQALEAVQESAS